MIEKNGMLSPESRDDFGFGKKAEYVDADGFHVADKDNAHRLNNPVRIADGQPVDRTKPINAI